MAKLLKNTFLVAAVFLFPVTWTSSSNQACAEAVPRPAEMSELRSMTRRSGAIFAGRVLAIQYLRPRFSGEVATVRVTFRVERGIRGARTGRQFVLREWAPLWNSGQRYSIGERVLLFLYPASKVGLTSPVGGERGRFRLDPKGQVILGAERATLFDDAQRRTFEQPRRARMRVPVSEIHRMIGRLVAEE
jgi:hypothetical protein